MFFFTFYLAAQFNGAGKVLNVTFNIPHITGIIIGAVVIIIYTMMGGFFAVAWTDLIQGIIMIGVLIVLPIVGLIELSEQGQSLSGSIASAGREFSSVVGGTTGWAAVVVVIGGLSWGLGYMGQPHLLSRFMAIKDPEKIKTSRRIAIVWAIPAFFGAIVIGLIGLALYGQGQFSDVEKIMPQLANTLLPAWLAGIFISGAIAAMMSTADSQLLVITSSVIEDFYHKTLGKDVSEKTLLNLSRMITIVVGVAAFVISVTSKELIFSLVSYAWAGLGSSFGPALLLMLKWKGTTKKGVLAGMLTGSITTIVWPNIPVLDEFITERFSSFVLAFFAVVAVSLLTLKDNNSVKDANV
jgi:sodium/proline symporter